MSEDFSKGYNKKSFWAKVRNFAKKAGKELIEKSLTLYYTLQDDDTPIWAKGVIISALGYFIVPVDALPDPIYADDLGAITAAFSIVLAHVKPEHIKKAKKRLKVYFKKD